LADYHNGLMVFDPENLTLAGYLKTWLEDSKKPNVAPRTFANYRSHIRNHITPTLGGRKLRSLTPAHVQAFYREKLDSGLSPATVRLLHAILRSALKQALRWRYVTHNVAEAVDPPKPPCHEGRSLTPNEVKRLLAAARGERLEALYVVAISTGLRQGELLGLRWEDVDFEASTINLRRQLQRMRDGSGLAFLPLKNPEARREVALGKGALEALRKHRAKQSEERLMLGSLYENEGLVFATAKGTPLEASNVVYRSFKPLLRRAGITPIKFHELRHTCASLMASADVPPKYAQDRLGHRDFALTMNVYSHVLPEARAEVARKIEAMIL
jgi:integrase